MAVPPALQLATRDFTLSELAAPVGDDTHQFFLIPVADLMNHNDSPNVGRTGEPHRRGCLSEHLQALASSKRLVREFSPRFECN